MLADVMGHDAMYLLLRLIPGHQQYHQCHRHGIQLHVVDVVLHDWLGLYETRWMFVMKRWGRSFVLVIDATIP